MRPERFAKQTSTLAGVREQFRRVLTAQIERVGRDRWSLKVPFSRRPFEAHPDSHFHQGFEFVLQCVGRALWKIPDGVDVRVPSGSMLLFPRGVAHREYTDEGVTHSGNLNVYVGRDSLSFHPLLRPRVEGQRTDPGAVRGLLRFDSLGLMFDMLSELVAEVERRGTMDTPLTRGLLLSVLSMLLEKMEAASDTPSTQSHLVGVCQQEALRYLCSTSLNVAWLAQRLACNADYLSHIFHAETGQRLTEFINDERVKLGRYLLHSSTMNVSEIAFSCGYSDPNYFGRVFRKAIGVTPRAFRARKAAVGER